jgi:type I restriction enzyme S subunit
MSFPRYPKYKDSGIEWLGQVPEHWGVTALKRGYNVVLGKMLQPESSGPDDELLPYLRAANIKWNGVDTSDIKQMWLSKRDRTQLRLERGDLLVSEGGDVGRSCLWADELEECYFQNSVNRLRALDGQSNRYLYYWISTIKDKGYIDVLCNKSTIAHFTAEKVAAVPVPIPPATEQTRIAAFLDQETAKIDALVAEQERLMVLLKEKRQAVISHAVTKGLNPKAALKPSGIEWLGDVPEHWEVMSLRRCCSSVQTGGTPSNEPPSIDLEQGMVWYTPGDFGDSLYLTTSTRKISAEAVASGEAKVFPPKSVLIVSIGATLGKIGFAVEPSSANQQINAVIPNEKIDGYFLAYSLLVKTEVMRFLSNASTIGIMNQEKTKDIWLAVPPRKEQNVISAFLDTEIAKLDTLTAEAQRAIDLLQERRTALISAAVTGQIDVRQATNSKP